MTDEPDTAELENRIEKLEATIEKMMPSRRDALKMGGAALAGGSLMAGTASAGTNQVGTIGSASQPVDLESEDINNADTITTKDIVVNGTATGPFGSSPQAVKVTLGSSGAADPIPLDNIVFDTGSNFDLSKNAYVAPENGVYILTISIQLGGGTTARSSFRAETQAPRKLCEIDQTFGDDFAVGMGSSVVSLNQNDEITFRNSLGRQLLGTPQTFLSVGKIG